MQTIAIIGTGNIGRAIVNGLVSQNNEYRLHITSRNQNNLKDLAHHTTVEIFDKNKDAIKHAAMVIFALQPQDFLSELQLLKNHLKPEQLLISVVTGIEMPSIEKIVGDIPIVRAMPNTAIYVGKSMTCLCANQRGKEQLSKVEALFKTVGSTLVIPEEKMQAATVIAASGIAFWLRIIRATSQGAIQLGFESKEALEISTQACLGAASLLLEKNNHPEEEIDKVTTPRGCTIAGLNEMEHEGMSSALIKGIVKSYDQISEISKIKQPE